VWRVDGLGAAGARDPVWTLAFAGAPLDALIVNGELVVEHGELRTADTGALAREVAIAASKVAGE